MPRLLLSFSQSDHLIWNVAINSHTLWQTVQIQICWLLQKPTDLDLHCLQRQGISGLSRTRVKVNYWKDTSVQISTVTVLILRVSTVQGILLFFFFFFTKTYIVDTLFTIRIGQTGLSKQCRPKWDAAFCGVSSGSALFATHPAIFKHCVEHRVVNCICSNFRTRMLKSWSIWILRVNMVLI